MLVYNSMGVALTTAVRSFGTPPYQACPENDLTKETILVTGGAGFIGSHIVDACTAIGYRVVVVDNLHTGKRENIHANARFYHADICDLSAIRRIFAEERPEVVCHHAALADVRASLADPIGYTEVNVTGTLNLLEATREQGSVRRFVFASTGGAVYGEPTELPTSERCLPQPLDPYGASKLSCEYYIDTYRHNHGLEYTILRYSNVYGPRQDPTGEAGVVAIFTAGMLANRQVTINGDGLQRRDFVYVEDVARANLLALESVGSGVFNLGTGVATDINTMFRELAHLVGYTRPEHHGPPKAGEVRAIYLDCSRARQRLGWEPLVPLSEGLARTVAFFRPP
jgi:UDP-glucose 4-epimerase